MTKREKAVDLFLNGYNCAQSVFAAFCDETGLDEETALRLSSSFGGGMGRLREVCGAVSGMFMVTGILYGYSDPTANEEKAELYAKVQDLAERFKALHTTIICRELLALPEKQSEPVPEVRTAKYYHDRRCADYVGDAAEILESFIKENS